MLKDIHRPEVNNIILAAIHERDVDGEMNWNVYLINMYDVSIRNVMVSSKGYGSFEGKDVKTSVLRHMIGNVDQKDYAKVEMLMENLFGLNNEFWVSFYVADNIYDKKYVFLPESIKEENLTLIPVLNKMGVMLR